MPSSFAARTSKSMPNPSKNGPKQARGYPLEGPERSKTAQGHPGALQETPRDGQKASPRASGSALEALWARLERHLGVQEVTLRGDFEPKMKIDSGNADFLKSMLSPRREHRFGGPEGPKMQCSTLPCSEMGSRRAQERLRGRRKRSRDDQKAIPTVSGNAHDALWARLERH